MVLRSSDFPVPKIITAPNFDLICRTFHISSAHQPDLKNRLDTLVMSLAEWMTDDRRNPDRLSDRERLENALACVEKAAAQIDKLGPSGRRAIREIAGSVAPILAAQWLNERFPDDAYAPQRGGLPPTSGVRASPASGRARHGQSPARRSRQALLAPTQPNEWTPSRARSSTSFLMAFRSVAPVATLHALHRLHAAVAIESRNDLRWGQC